MHWMADEAFKHGAVPLCGVDDAPMTKHSKDTGRFGHLVKNEQEHAWHVTEWAWTGEKK